MALWQTDCDIEGGGQTGQAILAQHSNLISLSSWAHKYTAPRLGAVYLWAQEESEIKLELMCTRKLAHNNDSDSIASTGEKCRY